MMNTALLKQTLSEKVAAQATNAIANTTQNDVTERVAVNLPPPTLSLVLTFPVALGEAQEQFERIQSLIATLKLQNGVQYQVRPSLVPPLVSNQPETFAERPHISDPKAITPPTSLSMKSSDTKFLSPASNHSDNRAEQITLKQQQLLQQLVSKRRLTLTAVQSLLRDKFGVEDGNLLSRRQASDLINLLLAK